MLNVTSVSTPAYVVDEHGLKNNLRILDSVIQRTGCKILLAQKAFSMFSMYPLIGEFLHGTTASSLYEARLGREEMGKETHIFAPAYREEEFDELMSLCDHIIFNSMGQWEKYKYRVQQYNKNQEVINPSSPRRISCGLRINPEYSEITTDIYNPCFEFSRFGIPLARLKEGNLDGIEGLHFHTMCEQNSDVLKRTLQVVEEKFGDYLMSMKWINFGGGHHITREDYDLETLISCVNHIKDTYQVQVYLEPGEAVALNAGWLVSSVLDIMENGMEIALMDTSAACHMPDVLEMPYRPHILNSGKKGEKPFTYRLGGPTCLSGDVIGDYSFDEALKAGDKLVFCDMAIYSMVKNNTFNGIALPTILLREEGGNLKTIRSFGYEDFRNRLS